MSPTKDYRGMWAAAYRFFERNNPPSLSSDKGVRYWDRCADDMASVARQFNDDEFMAGLLEAAYLELEREYYLMRSADRA